MYRYTRTHSRGRTLSLSLSLSVSLSLSHTHAHARTCIHTYTRAHARTHIHYAHTSSLLSPPPPPPPPSDVSFPPLLPTRHLVFLPSLSLCLSLLPICPWQRNKEPSKPGVEVKLLTVAMDIRRERERANRCNIVYSGIPVQNTGSGVKYRLESGRSRIRIPLAPRFFRGRVIPVT